MALSVMEFALDVELYKVSCHLLSPPLASIRYCQ